jgi:hypothetical protein
MNLLIVLAILASLGLLYRLALGKQPTVVYRYATCHRAIPVFRRQSGILD